MIEREIRRWLDTTTILTDDPYPSAEFGNARPTKRRRFKQLTTPPQSMDSPSDHASLSSRQQPLDDKTPRAKRARSDLAGSSYSVSDHASMSPSSSSARSGRTSPLKQMRRLRHDPHGLDMRPLRRLGDMTPCLKIFLDSVAEFAQGRDIVTASAQDALVAAAASDGNFDWARQRSDYLARDEDSQVRSTPPPRDVLEAVEAATECSSRNYPEATWNVEVHHLILRMALRPVRDDRMFQQLVNFTAATTATIIPDYGNPAASKRVDICLYIDPENDSKQPPSPRFRAAVESLRGTLPHGVVNFTDFDALDDRFVALSIETKKPGENTEAGKLQLGVWEMARWNFLRRLAGAQRHDVSQHLPTFLPSILVDGNEWFLLVTTTEGDRTVLWHRRLIGSTSETRGVYQIVRTLQYMAQWARDVHWPYLRSLVESHARDDASL